MTAELESLFARTPDLPDEAVEVAFVMDGIWAAIEQGFGIDPVNAPDWQGGVEFFLELDESGVTIEHLATLSAVACQFAIIAYRQGREHGASSANR